MPVLTWIGIGVCIIHSGIFSGLNLALFGVTRLRLEVEVASGNKNAQKALSLRKNSNFLLTTILWGNVAYNTLLAILANSVLTGVLAFVFSTFFITFIGEIIPQAYFSRHALKMASLLAPVIRFYQIILFPVARTTAALLDWWLGKEGIQSFREHQLREVIKKHIEADEADVDRLEGLGALNFLALDDLPVFREGERIDPSSVISLPIRNNFPVFPPITHSPGDPFLKKVQKSNKKWVVITDEDDWPRLVLDADGFLRSAFFRTGKCNPARYSHRPIVVTDENTPIGEVMQRFRIKPKTPDDDVIDRDLILVWSQHRMIITGADILGRLLRGIVMKKR